MTEGRLRTAPRADRNGRRLLAMILVGVAVGVLAPTASADGGPSAIYPHVGYEKVVVPDRFGDGLLGYLELPADASGKPIAGRFPVVLHYTYFPALTWERSTGPLVQQFWTAIGFNLAQGFGRLVRHGYVVANVAPPGTGGSQGPFTFNTTNNMALAGYDVVEWLARQSWSNGKIGMYGGSGNGIAQLMVAALHPPHLATIIPAVAFDDLYSDVLYKGGVPSLGDAAIIQALALAIFAYDGTQIPENGQQAEFMLQTLLKRVGQTPPPYLAEWYAHPLKTSFWDPYIYDPTKIDIPVWSWGNWDDYFLLGNVDVFKRANTPDRMLTLGYDGHSMGPGFDPIAQAARWYDYWLKGEASNGIAQQLREDPVNFYVQRQNAWRPTTDWPPPQASAQQLFLTGGRTVPPAVGGLAEAPDRAGEDGYLTTPLSLDLSNQDGMNAQGIDGLIPRAPNTSQNETLGAYNNPTGHMDQRLNASASVTYLSAPLAHPVTIAGQPSFVLYAKSSASDTYWIVKLIDVFPASSTTPQPGYWNLVDTGQLEGTHRDGDTQVVPIPPGQTVRYGITMEPTAYQFSAGHRIGVQISSSDDRDLPNPNIAFNQVQFGQATPSAVTLPVLP
jgi:putative CocE/NonD family hydrolase